MAAEPRVLSRGPTATVTTASANMDTWIVRDIMDMVITGRREDMVKSSLFHIGKSIELKGTRREVY